MQNHVIVLCFLLFSCLNSSGAQEESVVPLNQSTNNQSTNNKLTNPQTRAVVVGISDYQDKGIPDLQYADRDAEAFANFLRSPAGGALDEDHLKVLTNEAATVAQFAIALDWLMEVTKEGDQAIIYFSGHGDVEKKTLNQPGFLLCWDAPARVYMAGGAFGLPYLQEIISTLSLQNKAKVIVITDACRSGKLAGSAVGGAQITGSNLAKQYANEIKILSCQPNEYSVEGRQWGGGRGVFSFYLVDGLYGLADRNEDQVVTLTEIDRYLEDHVTADVAPDHQQPMVLGDKSKSLSRVFPDLLAAVQQGKTGDFAPTENRGLEEEVLAATDNSIRKRYFAFKKALKDRQFFEPAGACAEDLYAALSTEPRLAPLYGFLKRNYAAALQDEVQQALNALLESDPYESNEWLYNPDRYAQFPHYLERAIELLGEGHYMRNSLLSKKLYFDAYLLTRNLTDKEPNPLRRDSVSQEAKRLLKEAIRLENRAPYLYHALAALHINTYPAQTDSVLAYEQKAMDLAPAWLLPYLDVIYEYQLSQNAYAKGETYLLKAAELNPESYLLLERLAWFRQWQGRLDEAVELCHKMIALKPDLFNGYGTLGRTYWIMGEHLQSRLWGLKSSEIKPGNYFIRDIVYSWFSTREPEEAMKIARPLFRVDQSTGKWFEMEVFAVWYLKEAERYDEAMTLIGHLDSLHAYPSVFVLAKITKGIIQHRQGQKAEAEKTLREALTIDPFKNPFYTIAYAWLGVIAAEKGQLAEAELLFQQAIAAFSGNRMDDFLAMEEAHYQYGRFLLDQNRLPEAEAQFLKANDWRYQNGYKGWYGLACVAAKKGDKTAALDHLEKALDLWYPVPGPVREEPLFKNIRKTKRFKTLMLKHFPENRKN